MPFEFLGDNLETDEAQQDFADSYAVISEALSPLEKQYHDALTRFIAESPERAVALMEKLQSSESVRARSLAARTLDVWTQIEPTVAVEVMIKALRDEFSPNRDTAIAYTDEWLKKEDILASLGLSGVARVAKVYSTAKCAQENAHR